MKIRVLILCICLAQLCTGLEEFSDVWAQIKSKEGLREYFKDSGDQFRDDLALVFRTFPNDTAVERMGMTLKGLIASIIPKDGNSKINVKNVQDSYTQMKDFLSTHPVTLQPYFDYVKNYETILSKELPPERYNGIIALLNVLGNVDATPQEIESSLNYYYGNTETTETKAS